MRERAVSITQERVQAPEIHHDYLPDPRDVEFNLFEFLGREEVYPQFGPENNRFDKAGALAILASADELAMRDVAASFRDDDQEHPRYDSETKTVHIESDLTRKAHRAYMDSGLGELHLSAELGGLGGPPSLHWAVAGKFLGANPALYLYTFAHELAPVLYEKGDDKLKNVAQFITKNQWGMTMVISAPDVGSDVAALRRKATRQEDGTYHVTGDACFITAGEHDLDGEKTQIVHLVLARPEGADPGTKGLALFMVPKYLINENGSLGERNGVYATGIERKTGLNGSVTASLEFGGDQPAKAYLVGNLEDGIKNIFDGIRRFRMVVGIKSTETASAAYRLSLKHAQDRVQGTDLTNGNNPTTEKVAIIEHPSVRRMLMMQKMYVHGLRALDFWTATFQDTIALAKAKGGEDKLAEATNDLLLPLVKGFGAQRASESLALAQEVYGGAGYLMDHVIQQYRRDQAVDRIYEGTIVMQAHDLIFRKLRTPHGKAAFDQIVGEIKQFTAITENDALQDERELLDTALDDTLCILDTLAAYGEEFDKAKKFGGDKSIIKKADLSTTRALLAVGDVFVGWLLLRQAEIAQQKIETASEDDRAFYTGKIEAAKFFARDVLPGIAADKIRTIKTTLGIVHMPNSAF